MKTKITLLLPTFFMFVSNIHALVDARKSGINIILITMFQFPKKYLLLIIASLRTISGSIVLIPLKVESLMKTIQPSIYITTIRCEYCYLQSSHFLTI